MWNCIRVLPNRCCGYRACQRATAHLINAGYAQSTAVTGRDFKHVVGGTALCHSRTKPDTRSKQKIKKQGWKLLTLPPPGEAQTRVGTRAWDIWP